MERLLSRLLQPRDILGILKPLDHFLVFLDRQNYRHRSAIARDNLRF